MISKEEIKKEVDKLPENLLEEVYNLLKRIVKQQPKKSLKLTSRSFKGKLDSTIVRDIAYE